MRIVREQYSEKSRMILCADLSVIMKDLKRSQKIFLFFLLMIIHTCNMDTCQAILMYTEHSTFRSATRKRIITVVNYRHIFIRHLVTVCTHNNNLQVLRTSSLPGLDEQYPFVTEPMTSEDDHNDNDDIP
jgi:hypothetical protein